MLVYGSSGPCVHLKIFFRKNLMAAMGHANFYFTFNLNLFYFCFDFILILFYFDLILIFFVNILFLY